MGMKCHVCNKKLNIFSDYTQIEIDGQKREICTPCNRKREKEEIKQLLKTDEGKKDVYQRGSLYISTGILEIGVSLLLIFALGFILWIIAIGLFCIGCFSVYKGMSYKSKAKKKIK